MTSLRHQITGMLPDEEGTPLDWGKYEDEILDLFITKNRKLREVMEHLAATYNFTPRCVRPESVSGSRHYQRLTSHSEAQYKRRFPRLKNVTNEEWAYIDAEYELRAAFGKQSTVYLLGRPLPL